MKTLFAFAGALAGACLAVFLANCVAYSIGNNTAIWSLIFANLLVLYKSLNVPIILHMCGFIAIGVGLIGLLVKRRWLVHAIASGITLAWIYEMGLLFQDQLHVKLFLVGALFMLPIGAITALFYQLCLRISEKIAASFR